MSALSPTRAAALVSGFDTHPAYAGLAEALRQAIVDGRIPHGTRLPSERDLAPVLSLSRTTVTRAYAVLTEKGCARARRGAGTFAQLPGGASRSLDRALTPSLDGDVLIDLNCAAASAAAGMQHHYEAAVLELPGYLTGHGYFLAGLPELQAAIAATFEARGLPTSPDQILISPGALSATAMVARGVLRRGDRLLVENPVYPNAPQALRDAGARLFPVPVATDGTGWDLDTAEDAIARVQPAAAYLIPDFQNPTGSVMAAEQRERLARALARRRTVAIIDESHHALALDEVEQPAPLAAYVEAQGGVAVTVGSASKSVWGGLRIGWLRAPHSLMPAITQARLSLDLGVPVLEQLVMLRVLAAPQPLLQAHLASLRAQRAALVAALRRVLPTWRFTVPSGGLALWIELPEPLAFELSVAAERHGVAVAPGPIFAVGGGLARYLRIPWTRPAAELERAVTDLAAAWAEVTSASTAAPPRARRTARVMVA